MARAVLLLLLVSAAAVALGCSSSDLVGSWDGNAMLLANTDILVGMEMTFDSDGTFTLTSSGQCLTDGTACESEYSGVYSYNDTSAVLTFSLNCESDTLPDCCSCPTIEKDAVTITWSTCESISTYVYHGYDVFLNKELDNTGAKIALTALIGAVLLVILLFSAFAVYKLVQRYKKKNAAAYTNLPDASESYQVQEVPRDMSI